MTGGFHLQYVWSVHARNKYMARAHLAWIVRTGKRFGFFSGHCSEMPQIALVSDEHNDNISIGVVPQLLQPSGDVLVSLMFADVVDE